MNQPTRVILVRHGQTQTITNDKIHGQTDGPLSEKGLADARKTADFFRGQSFDAFYSSPLGRAMTTARMIGETINMQPVPVDGLKERFYGWLEGRSMKWFEPDLSGPKITLPLVRFALWASGEHSEDFVNRITTTFDALTEKHPGERIFIVLHWGVLGVLNQHLLGQDVSEWRRIGPWIACGISEFHHQNGVWKPMSIDNGDHLL